VRVSDSYWRGVANKLAKEGIKVVGVPKTIDNDLNETDYTFGFNTAITRATEAIQNLHTTAKSHHRTILVEIMGRHAGYIAMNVGISGGAEVVLVPEKEFDINKDVIRPIIEGRNIGKKHYVVVVAEGAGGAIEIAKKITEIAEIEARATILGHIQRGGSPTVYDRVIASRMGVHAVNLLKNNIINRIVILKDNKVTDLEITEALNMKKTLDEEVFELNKILSI